MMIINDGTNQKYDQNYATQTSLPATRDSPDHEIVEEYREIVTGNRDGSQMKDNNMP